MKAVSKAKTPLQIRYLVIAYKDKSSGEWKILSTIDDDVDVDKNVAYFSSHLSDTKYSSEQDRYLIYAHWLLKAGRIRDAATELAKADNAREEPDDPALAKVTELRLML